MKKIKVKGIIPGDLETNAKCTTPSPSHKSSLKSGNKPSSTSSQIHYPGSAHAAKLPVLTPLPSFKIGKNATLAPIRIDRNLSSQGGPRQEKDSWRRSLQRNGYCKSKEKSSHPVTTPGGRSMVSGHASAKRKGEHVVDGGKGTKRLCFHDLGPSCKTICCEPMLDLGLKLSNEGRLKPQEVGMRTQSPPRSRIPATHARQGLESPSREVKKGTESLSGTPVPILPCPHPDRGGPKRSPLRQMQKDPDFFPLLAQCASKKLDVQATYGQLQSCRANQPKSRERSSVSYSDIVTSTLPTPTADTEQPLLTAKADTEQPLLTAIADTEQPLPNAIADTEQPLPTAIADTEQLHTTNSPLVRLGSGATNDGTNVSPHAGSCFPDSPTRGGAENFGFLDGPERGSNEDQDLSDLELDLGAYTDRAYSTDSEDEPLLSLQEILERSACPASTPEKGTYPEPAAPVHELPPLAGKSRPVNYKNTLEQMLKEKKENQRSKDTQLKLLLCCKEDLLKLAEDNTSDGTAEEGISLEHRAILKRFSVVSNGIPDVHPGEELFTCSNFGRLFSQESLDLRNCSVTPQNAAQKTLLQASPDELDFLIGTGMLLKAYRSSPCQPAVSGWLFQMMSVHLDRKTSTQILRSMKDIALIAADQIMANKSRKFEVWTPSIQDVVLIFLNMGIPFVSLFPLVALQPPFSEADILQSTDCLQGVSRRKQERGSFPEHSLENLIKYLALCTALCPRAYSDGELLLLLTVVCRVSLETRLQLLPMEDMCWLLHHLLNNTRDWDSQLPQICLALTALTEDHHNLRRLVQLLPDHKRGKQLRKHLSLSIISKLLNHRCTYKPVTTEFQLSALQQYLPQMRPSSLLSAFFLVNQGEEGSTVSQDQQAYYLCYSLLALANEASNFDTFPSNQKDQLQLLSAELEKHIKCDIREGEQWLYRSKVKDFVARIYTRWQVLLHKSKPMQGKLHDYWQPLPEDTISSSQESQQA
ncbi:hypothetical protein SKAU_G00168120 [Synaphobranchus kaupii]|uniref:Coiled-coil SMC6 And NSE5 INteracting (CANIN) domain-containing protein n=1 Tax=Synaphobranchus kaupii TaxID=118154 RepID=A0A9Q1J0J6_SYNKA|nr:hypothetical protein SKAU_G00168120 [Synaphobranchus kaupii]